MAQPEYNVTLDATEIIYWDGLVQNLEDIKINLNLQVGNLTLAVDEVNTYFTTYIEGNQLTQVFYG